MQLSLELLNLNIDQKDLRHLWQINLLTLFLFLIFEGWSPLENILTTNGNRTIITIDIELTSL